MQSTSGTLHAQWRFRIALMPAAELALLFEPYFRVDHIVDDAGLLSGFWRSNLNNNIKIPALVPHAFVLFTPNNAATSAGIFVYNCTKPLYYADNPVVRVFKFAGLISRDRIIELLRNLANLTIADRVFISQIVEQAHRRNDRRGPACKRFL